SGTCCATIGLRPERHDRSNTMRPLNALTAIALALTLTASPPGGVRADEHDGIIKVRSAYPVADTVARIKKDVAAKGIRFFIEIDPPQLPAAAKIALRPPPLLVFGNPPLGTQFITANPLAGLDWPVRLLVTQDESGTVWAAWTDFAWIAQRHRINDRDA